MKSTNDPEDMPIIFSYSRAEAIADGVLVDLTEWAGQTGFRIPVACTAAVWNGYIVPADQLRALYGQSERGRAHDVLWMLYVAIRKAPPGTVQINYRVLFRMPDGHSRQMELKAVCGPGDAGEATITIMLPEED